MNRLTTRPAQEFAWFTNFGRNLLLNDPSFTKLGDFFGDVKFPKYNVLKEEGNNLTLEIALAGYKKTDLNIELSPDNILTVSSSVVTDNESDDRYFQHGIAARNFTISWNVGTIYEIGEISYVDGMLRIPLKAKAPEKPKVKLLKIV